MASVVSLASKAYLVYYLSSYCSSVGRTIRQLLVGASTHKHDPHDTQVWLASTRAFLVDPSYPRNGATRLAEEALRECLDRLELVLKNEDPKWLSSFLSWTRTGSPTREQLVQTAQRRFEHLVSLRRALPQARAQARSLSPSRGVGTAL